MTKLNIYKPKHDPRYRDMGWYVYDEDTEQYLQRNGTLQRSCNDGWFKTRKQAREARQKFLQNQNKFTYRKLIEFLKDADDNMLNGEVVLYDENTDKYIYVDDVGLDYSGDLDYEHVILLKTGGLT